MVVRDIVRRLIVSIPNDIEKRWWIDVSATPSLVESFRPALVGFLAFDRNREPRLAGTGFVVAVDSHFALVISAKHVFTEGVLRAQCPQPRHAPSAVFVSKRDKAFSAEAEKLKVMWGGNNNAAVFNVCYAHYGETLDLINCIVMPQPNELIPEERVTIPLDVDVPPVGEIVHMVSMDGMNVQEVAPPSDISGKGQTLRIFRKVSIRVGVVTAVYHEGYRQYRWPCFTTSIPAEPGMSGGFVYWPREGTTIAACGVVCADNSLDEARHDFSLCGESVVGCSWPAFGLRIPSTIPPPPEDDAPNPTLFEMIRRGDIPSPIGGIERIKVHETDNGDCIVEMVS